MTWNSLESRSKVSIGLLRMSMPESKREQSRQKPYSFIILISDGVSYHLYHNIVHRKKALNAAIIQGTSIIKVYIRDHFKNVYYKVFYLHYLWVSSSFFVSCLNFLSLFFFFFIEWLILHYTMHYILYTIDVKV